MVYIKVDMHTLAKISRLIGYSRSAMDIGAKYINDQWVEGLYSVSEEVNEAINKCFLDRTT